MTACPITGEALIAQVIFRDGQPVPPEKLVWERTDPEIHVSDKLLANDTARSMLEQRYVVGEPCTFLRGAHHARLKAEETT